MSFMNLKKLKQTAEDVNIVPHPLRGSVDQPVLKAYLKGIVLACFVDDGKLSDVELKSGRAKALALGLEESDFDDAVKVICQLSSDEGKESCLADVLSYIRDAGRTVSFYFVTDLASGMASDGELTQDAVDFLDAVYGLLKLAPADIKFVSNYRPFLIPGRTADASSVVLEAVMNGFDFPEGYVKYFTPDLKPVKIAGGECKESKLMICSGRYLLEEHLTVSKNTELIIKDAEITFGPNAYMSLGGTKIVIENCKFLAAEASVGEADNICSREFIWAYDVGELEIVDCEFDGRSVRSLIGTPTETIQNPETISLKGCRFRNLKEDSEGKTGRDRAKYFSYSGIIQASSKRKVECVDCSFYNCVGINGSVLIEANGVEIRDCVFEQCRFDTYMFATHQGSSCWPNIRDPYISLYHSKIKDCFAKIAGVYLCNKCFTDMSPDHCCFVNWRVGRLYEGDVYESSYFELKNPLTEEEFDGGDNACDELTVSETEGASRFNVMT